MPRTRSVRRHRHDGPLRSAHYERCSDDDRNYQDFSTIENQAELNTDHIQKKGWSIAGEYSDRGKTGTNLERRGFEQMLADAQAGRFDIVTVTYMSRLARGPAFHAAEYLLKMAGVRVEMVKEHFGNDLAGQINRDVTILIDGIQPKQAADHTRTKMQGMVKHGYFCGGQPPFGYMKVVAEDGGLVTAEKEPHKRLMPQPEEAELVKQAFHMAMTRCTQAAICDYLKMVTTRRWDSTKVKQLLTNEIYLGIYQFGDWRNECCHPPIIAREIWDAVQEALGESKSRRPRNDKADDYVYYLRGRIRCPHCHCEYTQASVKTTKRVHYYSCVQDMKRVTQCPVKRLNADALHFTVLSLIERAARHHTIMHQLIAQSEGWSSASQEQKETRGSLAKKRAGIQTSINNIVNAIAGGRESTALMARLQTLEQEDRVVVVALSKLEKEIERANVKRPTAEQVQTAWGAVLDIWGELIEEEKGEFLGKLVESVEVKTKDRIILRLAPFVEVSGHKLAINSQLGAGAGLEPATFGL